MRTPNLQQNPDEYKPLLSEVPDGGTETGPMPPYEHVVCRKNLLTGIYEYKDSRPLKGGLKAFVGILTTPHPIPEYSLQERLGFVPDTLVLHFTNHKYWYVIVLKREQFSSKRGFYIIGMKKDLVHVFYFPSHDQLMMHERMEMANRIIPELMKIPWVNTIK
jgi:hypothetical protein